MKHHQVHSRKILLLGIMGIVSLILWGIYLFLSNEIVHLNEFLYIILELSAAKMLGLTASVYLILHELKIHIPLADKLCYYRSITNCDKVLTSKVSKLFGGVTWADIGFIYFTGTLLYLTGANESSSLGLLALLSLFALPYPLFSIYYQAIVIKTLCPFCLIVQAVLIAEFIFLLPLLTMVSFAVTEVLLLIVTFSIPASIWFIFKDYRKTLLNLKKVKDSYLNVKRDPQLFRFFLENSTKENNCISPHNMVFGKPDAIITITAFLNLYCKSCAVAYKHLINLTENFHEIKLRLVFPIYDDERVHKLMNILYFIYFQKGKDSAINFLNKWYTSSNTERNSMYEFSLPEEFDLVDTVGQENSLLFDEYKVTATPAIFINECKYPQLYDYSDIEYHISELSKLTEKVVKV